jgi:hypothetical protein
MMKKILITMILLVIAMVITSCSSEEEQKAVQMDANQTVKYANKNGNFTYTDRAGAYTPTPDRVDTAEPTRAHGVSIYTLAHHGHLYTVTKSDTGVHSEHSLECSCRKED